MAFKINCIAIDDEAPALKLMEQFAGRIPDLHLLEKFRSPVKASEFLEKNAVDLVFCDIRMPELSGIELARSLQGGPVLIFTTAYSEFAAEAFDLDAADYLKKPFSFERFAKAVSKAKEYVRLKKGGGNDVHLIDPEKPDDAKDYFSVKADHKIIKIFYSDILFVEGFREYVKIITSSQRIITFERMKNMESLLPATQFMRVHRSYIIARNKVRSFSGNLLEIGEHRVPVSREMKDTVLRELF
jgi:DNA-binding LytR/AlgR family response regulator